MLSGSGSSIVAMEKMRKQGTESIGKLAVAGSLPSALPYFQTSQARVGDRGRLVRPSSRLDRCVQMDLCCRFDCGAAT